MKFKNRLIGIDRVIFVLDVVCVDRSVFCVNIKNGESAELIDKATGEVIGISEFYADIKGISLDDKDNYRIKIELKKTNQGYRFMLDVNVPKLLYNTNEKNANNTEHLAEVNRIVEKKLSEKGIYVDMDKARISSLEINVNSPDVKLYDAMKSIEKSWNTDAKKVHSIKSDNRFESMMIQNKYVKIKVYDKVKQLRDTKQLVNCESLTRIEITTLHPSAINTVTNYNPTMGGVVENWDKLERWFRDNLNKHIKKPCDEFRKKVINEMVEQLKGGHKTYDILVLQAEKGNLIDMDLFSDAMKKYYKETGKSKPHTVIKNTKNRFQKLNNEQYESMVGNVDALEKLWDEIGL